MHLDVPRAIGMVRRAMVTHPKDVTDQARTENIGSVMRGLTSPLYVLLPCVATMREAGGGAGGGR